MGTLELVKNNKEHLHQSSEKTSKAVNIIALIGIILTAFNLRIAAVAPSPIIAKISETFTINSMWHGILGMLPLLCFGFFGLLGAFINRKLGLEKGMITALIMIFVGELIRSTMSHSIQFFVLFSIFSLGGMGIGNVLILPAIKHYFPNKIGPIKGVYLVVIALSAAVPSAVAVPTTIKFGWRFSIGIWSIPAFLAILPWMYLSKRNMNNLSKISISKKKKTPNFNLYKSSLAWAITLVFSIGALTMYALIAWLPTILVATAGKTTAVAGVMLSVYNLTGLPHSIILPTLMNKVKRPYYFVLLGSILAIIGILGLGYLPQYSWGWIFPLGVSALLVPAGLTLVNLKSKTEAGVTALSGFVQSVGYIIAALGPFYVGHLHSTYHNWLPTCWFICAMAIVSALAGIVATRPKYIEDNLK